jgi:hypothetical protein
MDAVKMSAEHEEEPQEPEDEQEYSYSHDVEKLAYKIKVGDPYARPALELLIHRLFRNNGGLDCKTTNLLPIDLPKLTDQEVINVAQNMITQINGSKKSGMTRKAVSAISNTARLACQMVGYPSGLDEVLQQVDVDTDLRDSLIQIFLGKNVSPSPKVTFTLSLLSHGTAILLKLLKDRQSTAAIRKLVREAGGTEAGNPIQIPRNEVDKTPMPDASSGKISKRENNSSSSNGTIFSAGSKENSSVLPNL